jgi:hypothetical protein
LGSGKTRIHDDIESSIGIVVDEARTVSKEVENVIVLIQTSQTTVDSDCAGLTFSARVTRQAGSSGVSWVAEGNTGNTLLTLDTLDTSIANRSRVSRFALDTLSSDVALGSCRAGAS